MLRLLLAAAMLAFAPASFAADAQQMEANKKVVVDLYEAAINKKDFDAAMKFFGPKYIQHNPGAPTGRRASSPSSPSCARNFRTHHSDIKHVFADGDYVILHVHNVREPGTLGNAIMDIFKLENGKVVEHWDVRQEIPEKPANSNGMF